MRAELCVSLTTAAFCLAVAGAAATPASSAPPGTGCPVGFQLEPESILGGSTGQVIDLNNDDLICIRPLPAPPFPEGAFVFTDNVVP